MIWIYGYQTDLSGRLLGPRISVSKQRGHPILDYARTPGKYTLGAMPSATIRRLPPGLLYALAAQNSPGASITGHRCIFQWNRDIIDLSFDGWRRQAAKSTWRWPQMGPTHSSPLLPCSRPQLPHSHFPYCRKTRFRSLQSSSSSIYLQLAQCSGLFRSSTRLIKDCCPRFMTCLLNTSLVTSPLCSSLSSDTLHSRFLAPSCPSPWARSYLTWLWLHH